MVDRPPPTASPSVALSSAGVPSVGARIVVNGEPRTVSAGQPLADLLAALGLRAGSVVVERNGVALLPSEVPGVRLADGDILELVRAVAGG